MSIADTKRLLFRAFLNKPVLVAYKSAAIIISVVTLIYVNQKIYNEKREEMIKRQMSEYMRELTDHQFELELRDTRQTFDSAGKGKVMLEWRLGFRN